MTLGLIILPSLYASYLLDEKYEDNYITTFALGKSMALSPTLLKNIVLIFVLFLNVSKTVSLSSGLTPPWIWIYLLKININFKIIYLILNKKINNLFNINYFINFNLISTTAHFNY
jgi:hypothetical protein